MDANLLTLKVFRALPQKIEWLFFIKGTVVLRISGNAQVCRAALSWNIYT